MSIDQQHESRVIDATVVDPLQQPINPQPVAVHRPQLPPPPPPPGDLGEQLLDPAIVAEIEKLLISEVSTQRIAQVLRVPERMVLAVFDSIDFQQHVQKHSRRSATRARIRASNKAVDMVKVMHELAEDPEVSDKVRLDAAVKAAALAGVVEGAPVQNVNVNVKHTLQDRVNQVLEASFTEG